MGGTGYAAGFSSSSSGISGRSSMQITNTSAFSSFECFLALGKQDGGSGAARVLLGNLIMLVG